ncbi:MAG: aryl-sulfate sulfotransferase, partial [Longimicrobiales bacterium]
LRSKMAYLIDMQGEVVHRWDAELPPGEWAYLLDSGNLLRSSRVPDNPRFRGGGLGGRIQELDWESNVVWDFTLADDYQTSHHDMQPLPNGNLLLICWEHRFAEDVLEFGRDPAVVGEGGLWPDAILEIEPTRPEGGKIVWEWHAWDHLIQDFDSKARNHGLVADHPERIDINADHRRQRPLTAAEIAKEREIEEQMRGLGYVGGDEDEDEDAASDQNRNKPTDWLHVNAVDYHAEYDLIVMSTPRMNEIWVIDHSTTTRQAAGKSGGRWGHGGDLLYRWGNPRNYGAGEDSDRRLYSQHNPQWLPAREPGDLRLLVFNNGRQRPDGDYSSVDELVLPFDPERGFLRDEGAAFGPAEAAWTYSDPDNFFAPFISGMQRLPNGNTLICAGPTGRVFEVTPDGRVVWDYLNPHGGDVTPDSQAGNTDPIAIFRATRIPKDHPGLAKHL